MWFTLLLFVVHCVVLTQVLGAMHEVESEESKRVRERGILFNFEFGDCDKHVSKIPVFAVKSRGRQRRLKSVGRTRRQRKGRSSERVYHQR